MKSLKKVLIVVFTPLLYAISCLLFPDVWSFKKWLYNRKDRKFFLKNGLIDVYDRRMSKKASWIGYDSTFKDYPVFPHGISGIFVSGGV